jgi:hypothetical protein
VHPEASRTRQAAVVNFARIVTHLGTTVGTATVVRLGGLHLRRQPVAPAALVDLDPVPLPDLIVAAILTSASTQDGGLPLLTPWRGPARRPARPTPAEA